MPALYQRSYELKAQAARTEPTILARPGILGGHLATAEKHPIFAERASGAFVYDVDGNKYLDFILAFGSVVLGHCDPEVDEAVIRDIRRGISPTLLAKTHIRLAELVVECIPGAEMATFLRSGSDGTSAAVRLARAITGRRHVRRWGYQGWHDWCAPRAAGIPGEIRELTALIEYNNLPGLETELRNNDVACVIMMPLEVDMPNGDYLTGVQDLCRHYGTVFILDEVRSGFRINLGGAQAHFGVRADLAVFSKAMANGYAVSAIAGKSQLMEQVRNISMSSVFFRSSDGMAAATATIERLQRNEVIPRLWQLGRRLLAGIQAAATSSGVPAIAVGIPPMPHVRFQYDSQEQNIRGMQILCQEMLSRGILLHPDHHWFVCAAMTDADIDKAVSDFHSSFREVALQSKAAVVGR